MFAATAPWRLLPHRARRPQAQAKQLPGGTNVLITRFLSPQGAAEIQDFMPLGGERQRLIRRVVGVRGHLRFRLDLEPLRLRPPATDG